MVDYAPILGNISRFISLSDEEAAYFISLLKVMKVKKRQFIVQPDFVCRYRSYVLSGAMRAYLIDPKGQDHTIAFAIEDWWISDFYSFINQEPATLFVEALEDCTIMQLDYNSEQLLMEANPKFERYFRIIAQRSLSFLQKRMLSNLSKPAEERYQEFMDKYPGIATRVPQYALASYLGVSAEFLSKIRNQRSKKLK